MKANIIIIITSSLPYLNHQITYKNPISSSVSKTLEEIYVKIKQARWFCVTTIFLIQLSLAQLCCALFGC